MKKVREINFSGSIIIFFALLFVYSKWGPSLPISVLTQQQGEPLIVSGTGKVNVVPDIANVTLGIEKEGKTLLSTQDEVNKVSEDLVKKLKDFNINEKDIKTTSYNVYPQYNYTGSIRTIVGYKVSVSYQVKIRDLEKINDILIITASTGINNIGNISFEVNEETKKEKLNEAREIAVEEAKENAQGLAKASGVTLGKIINISENNDSFYPTPLYETRDLAIGSSEPLSSPNIQVGETEIATTVSLYYEIR